MRATIARYDGRCGLCDGLIREDVDEIVMEIVEFDGEWVHADCAEDDGYEVERVES